MKTKNQCMGCQAGWPLVLRQAHGARPQVIGMDGSYYVHTVVGGYPHESVACTADRYVEEP